MAASSKCKSQRGPLLFISKVGDASETMLNLPTMSHAVLPCSSPETFGSGVTELVLKFFTKDMKNHDKLQECDLFPSTSSLSYNAF